MPQGGRVPEIEIQLTADEALRVEQACAARGMTVDQLVSDELRRRYAQRSTGGHVVPIRKPPGEQRG